MQAGYFCIDTFTPINENAYLAARRAVDCTLTAAECVLQGRRLAYALVRPPGHHAERQDFGGFCYFNNAAVAANFLSHYGKVAVLDVDYHHGNGTQDIFYERSDVLTVSIHGHPRFAYPYFAGFREETGAGPGVGYNLNIPLPENLSPDEHREALDRALRRVRRHSPAFLVVAAGFDTAAGDPTGTWSNRGKDFYRMGEAIGTLGFHTLMVQEGGYRVRTLGANVRQFFEGLYAGAERARARPRSAPKPRTVPAVPMALTIWRNDPRPHDVEAVRSLDAAAGVFTADEVAIAANLVQERIHNGVDSGYHFVFAERGDRLAGYSCFGPIPGTQRSFDLYWIVVDPYCRRTGLGKELMRRTEAAVAELGGERMFVDTSASESYRSARRLYRNAGYRKVAEVPDFYREGDGKAIYMKQMRAVTP